ncbi:hypothetical protein HYH02_002711 [Chlamydomonas schloesseri]|uniref:Protein kinase domain-containing protein n=1 Tax=Chlamydomonas schloesseri TaxID=2026947 RepID=A0A835WRV1_9CHLO|nr:hypothetical protein HYH02_002711 [Chlamydomonas schloesseri]|eukprot:KAG2452471.1 hypothetical protein HYH02_002711 [Chlamydomonas schloesseri]
MEKATSVLLRSLALERWTKVVASSAVDGGVVEQQQQQQEQRRWRRTGGNSNASSGAGHAASSSGGGSYRLDHVLVLQEVPGRSGKRTPVAAIEVKHIPVLTQGAREPECFMPISLVDAFNNPGHPLHQRAKHIIGQVYMYLVTLGLRHGAITCWNVTWLVCLDHWDRRVMRVSQAFLASDTAPTVLRALSWLQLEALRFVTSALQQQRQQQQAGTAPPGAAPGGSEGRDGSHSSGSGAGGAAGGGDRRGAQRKRRAQQQPQQQQQQQQPADAMGAGGGGVDSGSGKAGRSGQAGEALLSALSSDSCAAELQRAPLADAPVACDTIAVVGVSPSTSSSTSSISRSPPPVEGLPQLPPPGQQEQQEEEQEAAAGAEEKPLQFLQQLGHGRDGMVFRCMYDGRPAVIKVYSWERHQVKAAAREEAAYRALAALQGSVVPKVMVTGRLSGDLRALRCLVMEPVEGRARPLSDCGYRRPFPEHVQAAAQQALSRAHAEGFQADRGGFLHGDVRLANILLVGGGGGGGEDEAEAVQQAQEGASVAHKAQAEEQVRCVLLDFGSSRLDGSAAEQAAELAKLRRLLGADGRGAVDDGGDYDDDYDYDD